MSRVVKKSPCVCTDLPLNNTDVCHKLRLMKELLSSCYGPTARLKQIHNNIGGHVVTTSASSVLLPALSSSQPVINLITASILRHVHRFSDCGLFAAIFCLSLVDEARRSGLGSGVATRMNHRLMLLSSGYLRQEECGCKVRLDLRSSRHLLGLAGSVLSSKPGCGLTEAECLHLSRLVVRAFLLTVPCRAPGPVSLGRTLTVPVEGLDVLESAVLSGLLLDTPEEVHLHQQVVLGCNLVLVLCYCT